jgi:hypothetical protein
MYALCIGDICYNRVAKSMHSAGTNSQQLKQKKEVKWKGHAEYLYRIRTYEK